MPKTISLIILFIVLASILGFSYPGDISQEDVKHYWTLYKDYPYVNGEAITDEQISAMYYFSFNYKEILKMTAERVNNWIKLNEVKYVYMK